MAVAIVPGGVGDGLGLVRGDAAVAGDNPAVELIGPLVLKKAQPLDPLDVLRAQGSVRRLLTGGGGGLLLLADILLQQPGGQLRCCGAVGSRAGPLPFIERGKIGAQLLQIRPPAVEAAEHPHGSGQGAAGAGTEAGEELNLVLRQPKAVFLVGRQQNALSTAFSQ